MRQHKSNKSNKLYINEQQHIQKYIECNNE